MPLDLSLSALLLPSASLISHQFLITVPGFPLCHFLLPVTACCPPKAIFPFPWQTLTRRPCPFEGPLPLCNPALFLLQSVSSTQGRHHFFLGMNLRTLISEKKRRKKATVRDGRQGNGNPAPGCLTAVIALPKGDSMQVGVLCQCRCGFVKRLGKKATFTRTQPLLPDDISASSRVPVDYSPNTHLCEGALVSLVMGGSQCN